MKFETIVFDTAPTGHTLRLLAFPSVLDKGLGKIMSIKNKIGGLFSTVCSSLIIFNIGVANMVAQQFSSMIPGLGAESPEQLQDKLESTKKVIEEVNKQFKNPVRTIAIDASMVSIDGPMAGSYDICLRLHSRVLVAL